MLDFRFLSPEGVPDGVEGAVLYPPAEDGAAEPGAARLSPFLGVEGGPAAEAPDATPSEEAAPFLSPVWRPTVLAGVASPEAVPGPAVLFFSSFLASLLRSLAATSEMPEVGPTSLDVTGAAGLAEAGAAVEAPGAAVVVGPLLTLDEPVLLATAAAPAVAAAATPTLSSRQYGHPRQLFDATYQQ